ncbi:hypothetical protein niasHT_013319 [Heterodera trifolii]|uniref:Uncharacterized protein n=1 Tax=Heterodera trifolii TaxID=157864 RepID=A0ABD2L365_9BILA
MIKSTGSAASRPRILFLAFSPIARTQPTSISITGTQSTNIPITGTQPTSISITGTNPPAFQLPGLNSSAFQSLGLNPPTFQSLGLNPPAFQSLGLNPPTFQSPGLNPPTFQSLGLNPPAFQSLGLNPPTFQSLGLNPPAFQSLGLNPPTFQSPGLNPPTFQSPGLNSCISITRTQPQQISLAFLTFCVLWDVEQLGRARPLRGLVWDLRPPNPHPLPLHQFSAPKNFLRQRYSLGRFAASYWGLRPPPPKNFCANPPSFNGIQPTNIPITGTQSTTFKSL